MPYYITDKGFPRIDITQKEKKELQAKHKTISSSKQRALRDVSAMLRESSYAEIERPVVLALSRRMAR